MAPLQAEKQNDVDPCPVINPGTVSHENVQAIGLDLGGTKLHGGTIAANGTIGRDILEPTESASEQGLFDQIVRMVGALRDDRPNAVLGLGAPGAIDYAKGALDLIPNIPFSPGRRLSQDLHAALGIPVILENDVNLAALAEARLGAGRAFDLVCMLSFGTGVGLGTVLDNRIVRGARGRAGEIAYLPIAENAAHAAARSEAGQFEDLVGTAGLRRRYGMDNPDVRTLFARADAGDENAAEAIAATAVIAAKGLASLQTLLDPGIVVIGGGIGMQKRFFDILREAAQKLLPFSMNIVQASLGPSAGMLGAIVLGGDSAGLPAPDIGKTAPYATATDSEIHPNGYE